MSALTPLPANRYILTGYTPFTTDNVDKAKIMRKTTIHDVMRRLLQSKNIMASISTSRQSCYISAFNLLRGPIDPIEVLLKFVFLLLFCLDSQEFDANSGEEARSIHSLGTKQHTRCNNMPVKIWI